VRTADAYPVPAYLPPIVVPVLPWARSHVARVMRVYGVGPSDLWDETLTALLRAAVYYNPDIGTTFRHYAQRAVNRACWRYVVRGRRPATLSLEALDGLEAIDLAPAPKTKPWPATRSPAGPISLAWPCRTHASRHPRPARHHVHRDRRAPMSRNFARERARHETLAPGKQRAVYEFLRAHLPDRDRALIGRDRILAYLHSLGLRRPNGGPISWNQVLRWTREHGFPLLHGTLVFAARAPRCRTPSLTTNFAITAWVLSRFDTGQTDLFRVYSRQDQEPGKGRRPAFPMPRNAASPAG
jgi:hypothetical protein